MTHVGEEEALRLVGAIGALQRLLELLLSLDFLARLAIDVAQAHDHQAVIAGILRP